MKMLKKNWGSAALFSTLAIACANPSQAADLNSTFSVDANVELNTDAIDYSDDSTQYTQSGRVEANLHGEIHRDQYFVRGKGTLILDKSSDTHTDDMWVQFGNPSWDVQMGRFEGIDLFPKGKDTLVVHAGNGEAQVYEANAARGRVGTNGGQVALHLHGASGFGLELGTLFGDDNVDAVEGTNKKAVTGVRPVLTYAGENFNARLGYDYQNVNLDDGSNLKKEGVGGGVTLYLGEALLNLNGAWLDNKTDHLKVHTYGTSLVYGQFGAGLIYSKTDVRVGADPDVTTAYVAYTVPLFDIDNASVTFAASGSSADNVAVNDSVTGVRLRINYTF